MIARERLVRLLRLDPDGRVAAMRQAVRDAQARADREHAAAVEARRQAKVARDGQGHARALLAAAEGAVEAVTHMANERDDRITRALHVLGDTGVAQRDLPEAVRRVLSGEPADPKGEETRG